MRTMPFTCVVVALLILFVPHRAKHPSGLDGRGLLGRTRPEKYILLLAFRQKTRVDCSDDYAFIVGRMIKNLRKLPTVVQST